MSEASTDQRRVALVTGASRGIGRAAALALARAGCHVVALARTVGGLEELDDAIKRSGGSATLVPADLTDFAALDRLGAAIAKRWGHLDILIGNAGLSRADHPARPCRARRLGARDGGKRHRELALAACRRHEPSRFTERARRARLLGSRDGAVAPIGAPTRSQRPRSKPWREPMRPRPRRRPSASCS